MDNKEVLISNIQSIQNDDGGFGFEKSDTYTTFLFVGILSALGNHPKDQDGCIFWIKQGQISDGGFIFRRDGNPTNNSEMYSTYISVVSLYNMNAEPDDVEGLLKWLMDCKEATGGFRLAPQYSKLEASPGSLEAIPEYTGWGLITLDIIQHGP